MSAEDDASPGLHLAHAVLLLALDERTGTDRTPYGVEPGLAGALVLELLDRGCLVADEDLLAPTDCPAPEDELLAAAADVVRGADGPQEPRWWAERMLSELDPLAAAVARPLVDRGILGHPRRRLAGLPIARRLGLSSGGGDRYPERDPEPERRLRERLAQVLLGAREPAPKEAALLSLIAPYDLGPSLVPDDQRKAAAVRARDIASRDPVSRAVAAVVRDMERAILPGATAVASFETTSGGG
jgi:hypothetical protein